MPLADSLFSEMLLDTFSELTSCGRRAPDRLQCRNRPPLILGVDEKRSGMNLAIKAAPHARRAHVWLFRCTDFNIPENNELCGDSRCLLMAHLL